ncbi:branched-chain amino acid aminotransferase II [Aspergillus sclerotiicarbonarius CBS 121057]|uniref:Branched-chain-amino-acid aminotransferase n=1 Tax=Aspergillus sclerotiicarbonarius (strain CBS 121057 / IBT 28362) TaxID=1448318 RepID=A0A319EH51_ASPSB|nr:branched-chain amino acid aminotransferase II [Aspergillus sclerotiicarbonarius CBS 121057]
MTFSLLPESEQGAVPSLYDPARMSQRAMTAHMVQAVWRTETGWEAPEMMPYGRISLEPTASVLHYATESFEGMKVYRGYDKKLRLFRPWLNCQRLAKSNARVCLPQFDQESLLKIIASYLAIECPRWLPEPGSNLYVRPTMIGSGSALGIQRPPEALFFLFGALFPQSTGKPSPGIKLLASDPEHIRAWPGGFGSAKVGASYGPAMVAQAKARENDCSQTLWLFGSNKLVTEAGASNFFVVWRRKDSDVVELVTSSLDTDIILDGITRRSILELARARLSADSIEANMPTLTPLEVHERPFTIDEILEAHAERRLIECFVSGTAMFVAPVSTIKYADQIVAFPMTVTEDGQKTTVSKYASILKSWLEDIMYGRENHEWAYVIDEK